MDSTRNHLNLCEQVLGLIDRMRAETGDERLGCDIERAVLESQIRELEREILDNPGAFEPLLVRRERRRA